MVIESYPFKNSSYGKGNNNNNGSSSSSNNGNCNSICNGNNTKPIHYKQLVNYLPDDIISLFTTRGVIVECHTCEYIYVDRQARNYFTYDYSICPNCKGFNVLLPKDGNNNNSNSNKKKHSLILEREYYNASSAIPFLARKDIPSDARVEVTLTFNSKDDAIKFIAWLSDKVNSSSNSSNSIKVLVTTH
jgi:hypothetical protein